MAILLVTQYLGREREWRIWRADDRVIVIVGVVYGLGFAVNGFVSGSKYKQAFFPRTSPAWQRTMLASALLLPRGRSPAA